MNLSRLEIESLYKTIKEQRSEIKELKKELTRFKIPQMHLELKKSEIADSELVYFIYDNDQLVDLYFSNNEEEAMIIFDRFTKAYIPTYSVIIKSQREDGIFMKLEKVYSTELCASKEKPVTKVTYSLTNNKEGLTEWTSETSTEAIDIYKMEEFVAKILEDWDVTFSTLKNLYSKYNNIKTIKTK